MFVGIKMLVFNRVQLNYEITATVKLCNLKNIFYHFKLLELLKMLLKIDDII